MKIDIYNHVMPTPYLEAMKQHLKDPGILKRMTNLRMLWDIEARVQMLDEKFPDVQQVLTLSLPSPELVGGPDLSPELARIANDGLAAMVAKWPKKFPAFVASLPMNNVPAALEEMDRAIAKLGARGVQICSSVNGRALDEPEFFPVFERAVKKHDVPIWMHPARPASRSDYVGEPKSKYEIWQVLRLAVRDQRRHVAHGVLGLLREASRHAPHHPPLRRHDPVLLRPSRDAVGAARQPQRPTRTTSSC